MNNLNPILTLWPHVVANISKEIAIAANVNHTLVHNAVMGCQSIDRVLQAIHEAATTGSPVNDALVALSGQAGSKKVYYG